MIVRRFFRYWMFIAAIALPLWPLLGWGFFGGGGWAFVGLLVAMPILFLSMMAIAGIITVRPTVRRERAVSWLDAGLLTLWHATIIGFGLFGDTTALFASVGVVVSLALFWVTLWELITDASRSAKAAMAEFEQMAAAPDQRPSSARGSDGEEIIVIHESGRTAE